MMPPYHARLPIGNHFYGFPALALATVILITPTLPVWAKAMSVVTLIINLITSLPLIGSWLKPKTPWEMSFLVWDETKC